MISNGAVLYGYNDVRICEFTIPPIPHGKVLIRILSSGICGRQICEINMVYGNDKYLPHLMGHEGYGIVEDIGEGVSKVNIGDHVIMSWLAGSGYSIQSNQTYIASNGDTINGGPVTTFSTYSIALENRLTRVEPMDPIIGALMGCAIPTGGGMVIREIDALPGSTICIVGLGGIGSAAALIAKNVRHYNVVAVDIIDRSAYSKCIGVDEFIFPDDILDRKFDYVIECTGNSKAMQMAVDITNRDDGTCIIGGNPTKGSTIALDPYDLIHGKRVLGTWGGDSNPDIDIPMYISMMNIVPYDKLIGSVYPFDDIMMALDNVGKIDGRILLSMEELS